MACFQSPRIFSLSGLGPRAPFGSRGSLLFRFKKFLPSYPTCPLTGRQEYETVVMLLEEAAMTQFADELKSRLDDAQKRFQAAAQELQAAQAKHQSVGQEVGSLTYLYQMEVRKSQNTDSASALAPTTITVPANIVQNPRPPRDREANKTEAVRQILRDHPSGMVPNELWKAVNGQIHYRPYLYSILKRLKDRGDVFQKRGKYFFRADEKPEQRAGQSVIQ